MDKLIGELEELTNTLLSRLAYASYEELEIFVEERQAIIDKLIDLASTNEPTMEQKQRVNALSDFDSLILSAMNKLKVEAQGKLMQRNRAKAQYQAYDSPYDAEAILMDKRK